MHEQKGMYSVIRNAAVYTMAAAGLAALVSGSASAGPRITLSGGEVVCDVSGKWDATYQYGTPDVLIITQEGKNFVGVKTIGNRYVGKGEESVRGSLSKDGTITKAGVNGKPYGWGIGEGKISENCDYMVIDIPGRKVTLKRKS